MSTLIPWNAEDGKPTTKKCQAGILNKPDGTALPFIPLTVVFEDIKYSIDMPKEMKGKGAKDDRLTLLNGLTGAFQPGVLTALMGVSGAGKTTLLDVLAGRKTGGYIEGSIKAFVKEVMELVELTGLKDAIIGLPGMSGLSIEQRKRLTIAVELVANPSVIFMDEPTSGLDARAAAIVMRTVRNTLFLMKLGGEEIYVGPLGDSSHHLVEYFQVMIEIPYALIQSVMFSLVLYPMVGVFVTKLWNSCSNFRGILWNLDHLLGFYDSLWFAWSLYGLVTSQYGDLEGALGDANGKSMKDYLLWYFGFKMDFLKVVAAVVLGFNLLFAFIFILSIKVVNYQSR
ncbi:hypothetical protein HU200_047581 [Digitaria exilis]|uniref:AAA+ ATPase domain-containing protein n=1 Tax=Digitaria exilis TaxID=1010633 RepID=A0A835B3P1_9POAL|nr:hypothetical protein HU200_047581 [Digitaria exilis]